MRKEIKRMLMEKRSPLRIVEGLKQFGLNVSESSVNFILKQEYSIEEKIYTLISSSR